MSHSIEKLLHKLKLTKILSFSDTQSELTKMAQYGGSQSAEGRSELQVEQLHKIKTNRLFTEPETDHCI